MNFFGVGGAELLAILIIMLVFAGPKRMIHWSYVLGQYVAKFRAIWSQTVDLVQKEFDEAGVDIKLPKEPPTRQNLNRSLGEAIKPMTKPIQDSIDEVKKDVDSVREVSDILNKKTGKKLETPSDKVGNSSNVSKVSKVNTANKATEATAAQQAAASSGAKKSAPEKSPKQRAAPAKSPIADAGPDMRTNMGSWSGAKASQPKPAIEPAMDNGKPVDLGAWSTPARDK